MSRSSYGKGANVYLTQAEIDVLWANTYNLLRTGRTSINYDLQNIGILGKTEAEILADVERKLNKVRE